MKKILLILVALSIVPWMVFGGTQPEGETMGEVHESAGQLNEFGWVIPENTISYSIYGGQGNPDSIDKNMGLMNEYLLEKFNVQFDWIVYDTDKNERLNLMLASGDYPDVLAASLSDVQFRPWVEQKKAAEISGLVDQYGPNIKKELGNLYKRYFEEDGNLYGLPRGWGFLGIPDYSAHIRWDWWQAMGAPEFKTTEDYYELLKKMQAEHPVNDAGEPTYALAWQPGMTPDRITGYWGLKDGWKDDRNNNLTYWLNTQEGLDMALYFNKYNVEGLLDPDSFSFNSYDEWKAKFSSERLVGHIGSWWVSWNAGHEIWQKTKADWNDDMRGVQVKLVAPGVETAYLSPKNVMGWGRSLITNKAKRPEDIIKWWDFEMTPMGVRLMGWGVPNQEKSNWLIDGNGSWSFNDFAKDSMIGGTYDFALGGTFGGGTYWQVMPIKFSDEKRPTTVWWDQNFNMEAKWKRVMNENLAGTQWDHTAVLAIKIPTESNIAFIQQQLKDIVDTGFAKAVMASSAAECRAEFEAMVSAANKAGLDEYQKFMSDEYKKNVMAWK